MNSIPVPSRSEFHNGCQAFKRNEKRDPIYKIASFLVDYARNKPSGAKDEINVTDGIAVLLHVWNQAFYRFSLYDPEKFRDCLKRNWHRIEDFRARNISTLEDSDEADINNLFNDFLVALQIDTGKRKGRKSPVAVAKALHLLAPRFFPLWDGEIAKLYEASWDKSEKASRKYITFSKKMQYIAGKVNHYVPDSDKSLLKLIDEYNYAKVKGWI